MTSYDQHLLDEAPKATRAQMQEGYNVDLLEQPPRRTPSLRNPSAQPVVVPPAPLTLGIAEAGSREKFGTPTGPYSTGSDPRQSFWRTRNGIITMIVIALVIVGAVVGGAVGGTVGKKNGSSLNGAAPSSPVVTPPLGMPLGSSTSTAPAPTQVVGGSDPTAAGSRASPSHSTASPTPSADQAAAANAGVAGISH